MTESVLDSSALLAVILNEQGRGRVQAALEAGSSMSVVNLSEVVARLADDGKSRAEIDSILSEFEITYYPFDERAAALTGLLRPLTRAAGLSLGDRACIALAIELQAPVLTGDRAWSRLDLGDMVTIHLFR